MKQVNIFGFFPLKDAAGLENFLRKDSELEDRKLQFFSIFIPCIAETKKKFANAVITAVFSMEYLMTHRWPTVS